jgi:hypothetical protein
MRITIVSGESSGFIQHSLAESVGVAEHTVVNKCFFFEATTEDNGVWQKVNPGVMTASVFLPMMSLIFSS